ncbi:hypothetical protein COT48_06185 [Candidatus Woesearchaeota archaeon CG08_land_8_20_14_0_20_47_9]|nr:MAG: hypothetical protein COV22_01845 [Candidatus Woesearchaeota archaeon CG10_big_fil_rev_8_21_14_0_10_47_5]PIO03099.1 MAG: hypothetical protein COT48_06185 [Candidatus Woesearchaeota archaeon CG08_land_8_20_14_0_20_47_9]
MPSRLAAKVSYLVWGGGGQGGKPIARLGRGCIKLKKSSHDADEAGELARVPSRTFCEALLSKMAVCRHGWLDFFSKG